MPNNVIFNLLEAVPLTGLADIGIVQKILSYKDTGFKYYLFNFPKPQQTLFGPYTLQEHHLTVNANERGEDEALRQYHYTAFFLDMNGKKYRLHCYYNSKDQLTDLPVLQLEKGNDKYERMDFEDDPYNLCAFARDSMKQLKDKLRAAQQHQVAVLQGEYEELNAEAEVLSEDLKANKLAYLKVNKIQIEKLEELQRYSNPDKAQGYKNTLTMLKKIFKAVNELSSDSQLPVSSALEEQDSHGAGEKNSEECVKNKNAGAHKKKKNLDGAIKKLKDELTHLKKIPVAQLVEPILKFFQDFVDVTVCDDATPKNLHDLKVIEAELDALAKKSLLNIWQLKKDNTEELLVRLKPFHHLIPENFIFIALKRNDFLILNFLLDYKISALNYRYFTIGDDEQHYSSLIDYCFKRSKVVPVTAQMVECLSILVGRGLSLLEIDSATGLPFAATLLLDPAHPFYEVLNKNKKLTVENPGFYEALKIKLSFIIAQPKCSPQLKSKIQNLLIQNEVFHSSDRNTVSATSISTAKNHFNTEIREVLGDDLVTRLLALPEVEQLSKERDTLQSIVLKKMSPKERIGAIKVYKDKNEKLLSLGKAKKRFVGNATFEQEKKATIDNLLLQIRYLRLNDELLDLCIEIRKKVIFTTKQASKQKRNEARQIAIRKEMFEIEEELNPATGIMEAVLKQKLKELLLAVTPSDAVAVAPGVEKKAVKEVDDEQNLAPLKVEVAELEPEPIADPENATNDKLVEAVNSDAENLEADKQQEQVNVLIETKLIPLTNSYLTHLNKQTRDEEVKLKIDQVNLLLNSLDKQHPENTGKKPLDLVEGFKTQLESSEKIIGQHRDNIFLRYIANVFKAIACIPALVRYVVTDNKHEGQYWNFWKPHGAVLVDDLKSTLGLSL